jgi:hypothetical protein
LTLSGELAVLQAAMFDGLSDRFALFDDDIGPAEVGVGRGDVVEALVVAAMIVVLDEGMELAFEVAGQEVVFEQNALLKGLVPAFDLALRLGMERGAAHVAHALGLDPLRQLASDVAGAIVAEQARLVLDVSLIAA